MMDENAKMVDAIEEGKIVNVTEAYAKKEGLLILRKADLTKGQERSSRSIGASSSGTYASRAKKDLFMIDKYRRPLKKNNVLATLKDNFHWEVMQKRKEMNISRRQAANSIGCSEEELKMIENGILPRDDYIIINKIQSFYNINLRKDGQDFTTPARQLLEEDDSQQEQRPRYRTRRTFSRAVDDSSNKSESEGRKTDEGKKSPSSIVGDDIEIID